LVSGNYFLMLGIRAHLGRVLAVAGDRPSGGQRPAVLSYEFWRRRFGSDPEFLGRTIHLNSAAFVIVGVSEPRFHGLDPGFSPEVRVPLSPWLEIQPGWNLRSRKTEMFLNLAGRLKPGVTVSQANTRLDVLHRRSLEEQLPLFPGMSEESRRRLLSRRIDLNPAARGCSAWDATTG
jgi:hypothetical protein